ncbi:MAG: precorrin-2 dehydrogenase/sirohydrochlorin ferrochelatase family protein [Deltaproteobacteria bacterium]
MPKSYPINLTLQSKKCVVAGGGKVGERKVLSLIECGADVLLVSPKITPALRKLATDGQIHYAQRAFETSDLQGATLAFAATDDSRINRLIANDAKARSIWVNAADNPKISDFTSPSVLRRGDFTIAVSTQGASPALARALRERLANLFGGEYEIFAEILRGLRDTMKPLPRQERERRLREVAKSNIPEFIREGNYEKTEAETARISGLAADEIRRIFSRLGKRPSNSL